jgi:hypothetical protein
MAAGPSSTTTALSYPARSPRAGRPPLPQQPAGRFFLKKIPTFLKNGATFCKMLTKKLTKPTFLKILGRSKNVDYKNVGPENVSTFCKMLTKITRNVEKKCWKK